MTSHDFKFRFSDIAEAQHSAALPDLFSAMAYEDIVERWVRRHLLGPDFLRESTWAVLLHLYFERHSAAGAMTKTLAATTFLSEATLARELERLASAGVIDRWKDDADGRITWNGLTEPWARRLDRYFAARLTFRRAERSEKHALVRDLKARSAIDVADDWDAPYFDEFARSATDADSSQAMRTRDLREKARWERNQRLALEREQEARRAREAELIEERAVRQREREASTRWDWRMRGR